VTELDASTGAVIQTIPDGAGATPITGGVSSDGAHVWVTNLFANTVSELNASTGSLIQAIGVGGGPRAVSSDGTHVWVANTTGPTGSVSELNASTGSVVQTIGVGRNPSGVSSDGTDVWVANTASNTVTELNASTGSLVETIANAAGTGDPFGISADGTDVWVTNDLQADASVSEITNQPPDATPEAPNVLMFAGVGLAVLGTGTAVTRRRRHPAKSYVRARLRFASRS
jgi:YVTN family beta-propeller protein